ncbi:MAG TPA: hypothetical protein VFX20_06165 [Steroidobacteraceae bacterium]|nr:hypothetical protein [Steroidobacteraceae bacterium]
MPLHDNPGMSRYLLLPWDVTVAMLIALLTLGLMLALTAGLLGIVIVVFAVSWFFKYCFALLDAVVAGRREPPVLSAEMISPIDEQRPLAQALVIAVAVLPVILTRRSLGAAAAATLGTALAFALPASVAILGLSGNPLRAMWPPALFAVLRGAGRDYLWPVAAMLAVAALSLLLGRRLLPAWIALAAIQCGFLLTFSLIGGMLFEHRLELGIESLTPQERLALREEREQALERLRMLDRAHVQFRVRRPLQGWQEIEAWLSAHAQGEAAVSERRALLAAVNHWEDGHAADRLANELIAMLLSRRDTGRALEVLELRLQAHRAFRPSEEKHARRLTELASLAGKKGLERSLRAGEPGRG